MTKVLVVEDDADLRGVLLRGLREEGFEAAGVGYGRRVARPHRARGTRAC